MNIKKFNKAQAALEFLTTYGWAFLVIIIMIGALAYFGILSPSKLLPNRCNFGNEFSCTDYQLKAQDVLIKLKNNVGEPIEAADTEDETKVVPTRDDGQPFVGCTYTGDSLTAWRGSETKNLKWTCTGTTSLIEGDKGKALITIRYFATSSSSTYTKEVKGEIYSTVLP